MTYPTRQTGGLRLDPEALGQVQPWVVVDRGLEYPGEVIVAETVDPQWGQPLEGDISFRVVFYTVPRRVPMGQIQDSRIAMAVPRRAAGSTLEGLDREIQAVRETRERYEAESDPQTSALRGSMEEREASLSEEVARHKAVSYASGRIYTSSRIALRPAEIFVEGDAGSWVERLAAALFHQAFPSLPFDYRALPCTLDTEAIELVYRGILQGDPEALDKAATFGPSLGLTPPEAPAAFDAGRSRVVDIIEAEIEARGGQIQAQDLLLLLCRDHGLNRAVATLYLLAYLRRARAEVELRPGHAVRLRDGGTFPTDRLSWDTVQDILFSPSVAADLTVVNAHPALSWNTVLPYAARVAEGLKPSQDSSEIAEQERRLLDALDEASRRLEGSREAIGALAHAVQGDAGSVLDTLGMLQVLCSATGYRGFYTVAVESFGGLSGLSQALDLYSRLEQLAAVAPDITRARMYLDEMSLGREHQDLAMKRDAVAARIGLDSLIADPSLWGSLADGFKQLRREYAIAYQSHHARYHQEAVEAIARLDGLKKQVEALARFNDVPEFDGPLGADLPGRFRELLVSIRTCAASEEEMPLDSAPQCQECHLPLSESVPHLEAGLVLKGTESAMREYNRRLSSEGVRRILAQPTKDQLDKLISLGQISDLTALANVLDEEVVDFLRGFMRHV